MRMNQAGFNAESQARDPDYGITATLKRKQEKLIGRCREQKDAITEFVDNLQPTVDKMQADQ